MPSTPVALGQNRPFLFFRKSKGHKPRPFPGTQEVWKIYLRWRMLSGLPGPASSWIAQWCTTPGQAILTSKKLPHFRTSLTTHSEERIHRGVIEGHQKPIPCPHPPQKCPSYLDTWNSTTRVSFFHARLSAPRVLLETANIPGRGNGLKSRCERGRGGDDIQDRPPSFYPRSAQRALCERKMGGNIFERFERQSTGVGRFSNIPVIGPNLFR